jgi:transposase
MWIIGCDFHPSFQQIAVVNQAKVEYRRRLRLEHKGGEAERFYRGLTCQQVRVGMEATGSIRWFQIAGGGGISVLAGGSCQDSCRLQHTNRKPTRAPVSLRP